MYKEVVITGVGIVSSIGIGKIEFWEGLISESSGIGYLSLFDDLEADCILAGEIKDFSPGSYIDKKGIKYYNRCTRFATVASKLALDDAGFNESDFNGDEAGVILGSAFGSLGSVKDFYTEALKEGPRYVNPMMFPNTMAIIPSSQVAINHGIKGINRTFSNGVTSGIDAICYAVDLIRTGEVKFVIGGGAEELSPFLYANNYKHQANIDSNKQDCANFGNPLIYGEGCGFLILEEMEHALKRGANIYARILGYGQSFSPESKSFRDIQYAASRSIEKAMSEAGVISSGISHICSSANSEYEYNFVEKDVIRNLIEQSDCSINFIKPAIGECFAASSSLQVCAGVMSLMKKTVIPTFSPEFSKFGTLISEKKNIQQEKKLSTILCNSFSLSGSTSSLVLGEYR
jgi:3-oxoacyl-[acyl-carrier-protein] synthase II